MPIKIKEVSADMLSQYAEIPIAFEVSSVFQIDLINDGLGGIKLREEKVEHPYIKDYDDCEESERPKRWPKRFDVSNWGFFIASNENQHVGGTVVAFNTSGVHMLAGRKDLAVLWDIRVHPDFRRSGIGTRLFAYAANWSKERVCKQLKIETQNVNVPACRFYAKQGCRLGEINRYAYAGHPKVGHEIMLIWYLDL
ncbi:GNAT family N-acetyltransferase [candidate division WOR-3 bacterium]|nr:GNAT family N-acetyltransferase [candidate division WOR-3 bacterium]